MKRSTILPTAASLLFLYAPANAALWTAGHGDIGLEGAGGVLGFEVHVGEGDPATVDGVSVLDTAYEPGDIQIGVFNRQQITTTDLALLAGVGFASGDFISFLPNNETQSNTLGTPLLGFGTEELDPLEWGSITFSLTNVVGPGNFSIFQDDGAGNLTFFMSTALGGITGADSVTIPAGQHDDFTFAFTAEGIYEIELTASGLYTDTLLGTTTLKSTTSTFTFVVPEPSSALLGALGGLALLRRRRGA